jgi:hypothetical protein
MKSIEIKEYFHLTNSQKITKARFINRMTGYDNPAKAMGEKVAGFT